MSRRRTLVVILVLALAGIVVAGWSLQSRLLPSRRVEVARQALVLGVEVAGTLKAAESAVLSPPEVADLWEFKISMMAPEGATVKKGAPVLAFDQYELQQTLDQQLAERDSARTEIQKSEADLTFQREQEKLQLAEADSRLRKAELKLQRPNELVSATERRQIEIDRDLAAREARSIRLKLDALARAASEELLVLRSREKAASDMVNFAQTNLGKMTVQAPRDGTVIYAMNWRNEKKKVGDTAWRAERILEIPDLRAMVANGEVDESDAGKISVGQRVTLRLDAHPDDEFRGRVVDVGKTVVQQSPQNPLKVLRMKIDLDRTDTARMKPGMRFKGTVETARLADVVVLPLDAIGDGPSGPFVVKRSLFGRTQVPLKLGKRNETFVQVLEGVESGEFVEMPKKKEAAP